MAYPQVFQKVLPTTVATAADEESTAPPGKVTSLTIETKIFLTYFFVAVAGGAIRKWFTDSSLVGNMILLIQMVLPFLLYYFRSPDAKNPFVYFKVLPFYFAYLIFHILNPMQLTIFHGLLGVIIYGAFWLGLFYYLANRDKFNFQPIMAWFVIAACIEIILGFIQYALPQGHVLNKYAQERQVNIAVVGDSVRITGTFSYLSGYTAYLIFHAFLVWALIRLRLPNWISMTLAGFGTIAGFMTGSRGGLLVYFAILFFVFIKEFKGTQLIKLVGSLLIPLTIAVLGLIASNNRTVILRAQKASENFWNRVQQLQKSGEQSQRISFGLEYFSIQDKFESPIVGVGTGATYQGATILFGKSSYVLNFGYIESEFIQVVLEGGIIMLLFRIILATILVLNLSFKGPIRLVIWGCIVYIVPVVFNVHNAAFFMMGIILVDNIIWRQTREKEMMQSSVLRETPQ